MASGVWDDFTNFIGNFVPKQTIPKLRQFADSIHDHTGMNLHLKSGERKGDLVDKIRAAFQTLRSNNNERAYQAIRRECEQIAIQNTRYGASSAYMPPPTFGGVPSANSFNSSAAAGPSRPPAAGGGAMGGLMSGMGLSSPQATRSAGGGWQQQLNTTPNAYSRQSTLQDWKPSPMWKPLRALTNMEMLPDIGTSENGQTRREKRVFFQLPPDVIELVKQSKAQPRTQPMYSVRLFCASSEHYRPHGMAAFPGAVPVTNRNIPIEYPANPDVMVDDQTVPFKERGLRGKAGSAPPLDLDKTSRGLVLVPGRMASIRVGHTGPTPVTKKKEFSKKFWFQIVVCEMTSAEELLTRLVALAPTDAEVERAKLRKQAEDDDDIQVGSSALSLKDPLSGMRITKPIRSSKCTHLQCFDARWWLESNKSHPQWLCPHCNKELKFDEVICDGYFLSMLSTVPDDYDDVTLEPNGEWHTTDNKYASAEWLAQHTPAAAAPAAVAAVSFSVKRSRSESLQASPVKRRAIEILSDSDDDDSPSYVPNGHSHTNGAGSSSTISLSPIARVQAGASSSMRNTSMSAGPSATASSSAVIDLTLSDSDDDEADEIVRRRNPSQHQHFQRAGGGPSRPDVASSAHLAPPPASSLLPSDVWAPIPTSSTRDTNEDWRGFDSAKRLRLAAEANGH